MQFVVLFSLIVATVYCLPAAHVAKGNVNKRESLPGFVSNGFTSMCDALLTFCNLKECTKENAAKECFGLPCNAGVCVCDTV
ncbi:unnamed protein product [Nippostrongylus brasiliensis]|uniref:Conserved secreted protein n=1 Tax=Nippostrongylus brasiliensis TaxID=27835 RepID=A0A0N4YHH8_NIPBR|nr:unnamed protein product [Nippostrongylus brasiliensis]